MNNKFYDLLKSTKREGIEDLIAYMQKHHFEDAPCSTKYHLAEPGGLLKHSLNVYDLMVKLNESLKANVPRDSIILCSLLHDLGKMGDYGKAYYIDNILKSGIVSNVEPYKANKDLLYLPHEVRSTLICERLVKLTEDEIFAIYYHNGKYTHIGYDLKETPLMMLLHFADLWASRVTEIGESNGI